MGKSRQRTWILPHHTHHQAKHHDGFCLRPSAKANYSVSSSPGKNGTRGVVQEVAEAAREDGIGPGLCLSPWDCHESCYGQTSRYNEYYLAQLPELLTNYGTREQVWLDGARSNGAIHYGSAAPSITFTSDEGEVAGSMCWSMFNSSGVTIGDTFEHGNNGDMDRHLASFPRHGFCFHSCAAISLSYE